jgi:hypothetical protein
MSQDPDRLMPVRLDVLTPEEIREATDATSAKWTKRWNAAQARRRRELADISTRFPLACEEADACGDGAVLAEAKRTQRIDDEDAQERSERFAKGRYEP